MKIIFFIALLTMSNMAFSEDNVLELNDKNLTSLALKNSADESLDKYALFMLKTENSNEYYTFRKDPEKLKQLIKVQKNKLNMRLKIFPDHPRFILKQTIKIESYDKQQGLINIRDILHGSIKTIARKNSKDGLPTYFFLLMANLEILNNIKVDKTTADNLQLEKNKSKPYYLEATLTLPRYQNNKNFQAVIENIKIFTSENKKQLLAVKTENRKSEEIINNRLLTDGITNKLIGIHSFAFFGYRLQDLMGENVSLRKICKKTIKLKSHQVVVCTNNYSENSAIIITYVGGIIAQLDLIATGKLSLMEKKKLSKFLMLHLGQTKAMFQLDSLFWTKYNVDFKFYADAFFDKTSVESKFYFPYNKPNEIQPSEHTLIVTMMSQATKKLIQEIK